MTAPEIGSVAPLFIVRDVPATLAFYRDRLGFEITFQGPEPNDIFFGIVQRGKAMIMFKDVGVPAIPNHTCNIGQGIARWDAFLHVPDPDALAAEFASRNVEFFGGAYGTVHSAPAHVDHAPQVPFRASRR